MSAFTVRNWNLKSIRSQFNFYLEKQGKHMIAQDMLIQLQHTPLVERLHVIEALLQSVKQDINVPEPPKQSRKPFIVRQCNLGSDVIVDRDAIYQKGAFKDVWGG